MSAVLHNKAQACLLAILLIKLLFHPLVSVSKNKFNHTVV